MESSRVTVRTLQSMKQKNQRITMLTAYDFPTAQMLDAAGVDVLLVGDTVAMVVQGMATTISATLSQMIYHGEMVTRATQRSMVVVDMPFPVGQIDTKHTVRSAARVLKRTGCHAVKLEGGAEQSDHIRALFQAGIPVIAHVGLRPQSVHAIGGYRVQRDRDRLIRDATTAEQSGAFCVLMECVPADLAGELTASLKVPTIGIGAGPKCDGQVLVTNDLLGSNGGAVPKFVRQYAQLHETAKDAVARFRQEIQSGAFPSERETFQ